MVRTTILIDALLGIVAVLLPVPGTPMVVGPLRVEALDRPLGLDVARPRFSWQLRDSRQGVRQTAYRLLIATRADRLREGRADVWDSGKLASDQSVGVAYGGPALESRQRYYWRVRVWDAAGAPTEYSAPSWWETGLLRDGAWDTPMDRGSRHGGPLPLFRKSFVVPKPVARARVYVTAIGSYRLVLNGARVGRDLLTPDWTAYHRRVSYQTCDVTALLAQGENVLGALVGPGWYGGPQGWATRLRDL